MGYVHTPVKGFMRQMCPTDIEKVRERLNQRLRDEGIAARALAALTGDSEKNVQRWVGGKTEAIPADFIGRCERVGFASAQWLLTGGGTPTPQSPGHAVRQVVAVRRVLDATESELEVLLAAWRIASGDGDAGGEGGAGETSTDPTPPPTVTPSSEDEGEVHRFLTEQIAEARGLPGQPATPKKKGKSGGGGNAG